MNDMNLRGLRLEKLEPGGGRAQIRLRFSKYC